MDQPAIGRHRSSGRQRRPRANRGNVVAMSLAALAVVLAGTGTAVAVTSTMTISDPTYPARIAHVDAVGRLTTTGPISAVNIATTAYTNTAKNLDVFSAPTTATLAVTKISVVNSSNNVGKYAIYFFQVPVLADGTCSPNITVRTLAYAHVSPGEQTVQDFAVPLAVRAISSAKYCLDFYAVAENSAATPSSEALNVQMVAYVAVGTYTGVGSGATPALAKTRATGSK